MVDWTAADRGNPGFQGDFAFDTIDCLGFCPLSDRSKGCLPLGLTKKVKLLNSNAIEPLDILQLVIFSLYSFKTNAFLFDTIDCPRSQFLSFVICCFSNRQLFTPWLSYTIYIYLLVRGMLYLLLGILLPWLVCKVFLIMSLGELIFWNRFGDLGWLGLFGKFTVHDFFVLPHFLIYSFHLWIVSSLE